MATFFFFFEIFFFLRIKSLPFFSLLFPKERERERSRNNKKKKKSASPQRATILKNDLERKGFFLARV
jgi:hypothetical protein